MALGGTACHYNPLYMSVLLEAAWFSICPLKPLLRSRASCSLAVLRAPHLIELGEVDVGRHAACLVWLRRLARALSEEAAVARAGAGAVRVRVGGQQSGRGTLPARTGTETHRGIVMGCKMCMPTKGVRELRGPIRLQAVCVCKTVIEQY